MPASASATEPVRPGVAPRPPLYFVNAPVDLALVGGLSLATFAALALVPGGRGAEFPVLVAVLARLCNWPHFAATNHRLYHSRAHVGQYPFTALAIPVLVGAATVWAFAAPATVAPWFVKLTLLWSPYHFSGQTIGLSLVYARRAGFPVGRRERLALAAFVFSAFGWATARAETGAGVRHYLGVDHPKLGLPPWVTDGFALTLAVAGVVLVALIARWCLRERRLVPPIVVLPALSQLVWFVVGRDFESFQMLVPFFHSLQYLLVAGTVQLGERLTHPGRIPSVRTAVAETCRWWSGNVVLGLLLFGLSPYLCTLLGYDLLFAMAVTAAAIQLHHFFVDGVIWKLQNPRVRSPLMVNVAQLLRPAPAPLSEAA